MNKRIKAFLVYQFFIIFVSGIIGFLLILFDYNNNDLGTESKQAELLSIIPLFIILFLNFIVSFIFIFSLYVKNKLFKFIVYLISFLPLNLLFIYLSYTDSINSFNPNSEYSMIIVCIVLIFSFACFFLNWKSYRISSQQDTKQKDKTLK